MCFQSILGYFPKSKGHFVTWPGINDINFIKNTLPTAKGHLDQERANLQSTKQQHNDENEDYFPTDSLAKKTYKNATLIYPMEPKLTTYSDQTGRFPHKLSRGNEYIMIMHDYDANVILSVFLKYLQEKLLQKHGYISIRNSQNMAMKQKTSSWTMSVAMISNWR